jgi:glycine oxidase
MAAIMKSFETDLSGMKMEFDTIICGNGIAGITVAFRLEQAGKNYLVIQDPSFSSSSAASAGIVNPITGKFFTLSWKFPELLTEAKRFYSELFSFLEIDMDTGIKLVRALYTAGNINDWQGKASDPLYAPYMDADCSPKLFSKINNFVNAEGRVNHALQIPWNSLIGSWTTFITRAGRLLEERFDFKQLTIADQKILYKDITAKQIIFCEGAGVKDNPFFNYLPLNPAKGEALLVKMEGIPPKTIFKDGVFIAPWDPDKNLFWIGSTYAWHDLNSEPTDEKAAFLEEQLKKIYPGNYSIEGQVAGIRPAVKDRRPLLGRHPVFNNLYIFNGLGTKGTSLAPFFSAQLFYLIFNEIPVDKEVDIKRFSAYFK